MDKKIGFIGTGQMATALTGGFIKSGAISPDKIFGFDILSAASERFTKATGCKSISTVKELVSVSDVIFFAVKPQQMDEVLHGLAVQRTNASDKLWITIAAGITINRYLKDLGTAARIVRVIPNTPCLVGEGVCGFCLSEGARADDAELAKNLLSTIGIAVQFPERQLNAVTGLSGSGPAFVYMMIESMADGGVKMGLSREVALKLAAQTVYGSAKVVLQTGEHPGILKDKVCSPRGTTIAAVHSLESNGFRSALIDAVQTATRRAIELAAE